MRALAVLLVFCGLVASLRAQADFELQVPSCFSTFPSPMGSGGDPEGVSWNGVPLGAQGATPPTVANVWPCTGSRHLLVEGGQPEPAAFIFPGVPPTMLTASPEVYVPVPVGAATVSFCWNGGPGDCFTCGYNDGFMIDVVDAVNTQLAVLVYHDTTSVPSGANLNFGACSGWNAHEVAPPGIKTVTAAALPPGAAFLRVSAWNAIDDFFGAQVVVDNITFGGAPVFDHHIVCIPVPGLPDSNVDFGISNGTPGALVYLAATVNANQAPNGWFYGINIGYAELVAQIAYGLPFNYVLDMSGNAGYVFPVLGVPCPLGITLDCVALEFVGAMFSQASMAKTVSL